MNMSQYEKLTISLPNEAAVRLRQLAESQSTTVEAVVTDAVDHWLEKRRREVRFSKPRQEHQVSVAEPVISGKK